MKRKLYLFSAVALSLIIGFASTGIPKKIISDTAALQTFDVIIVPGVPYNGQGWDSVMKGRVLWSYILYKNGRTKNIIYSGAAVYSPYYEARVMGLYGHALGIPASHIFYDTQARHSTENVYFSYLVARAHGFKSIALATDPFQSAMLRRFTRRRFATNIYHLPFVRDSLARYNSLNPKINAARVNTPGWRSLTEQENFLQRLNGTIGRNIDWGKYKDGVVEKL